jgi:hypothetical protein
LSNKELNLDGFNDLGRDAFYGVSFNRIIIPASIADFDSIGI